MLIFPSYFVGLPKAYEIEQSLRFNSSDSTNLSRTPGSTGNRKTFTVSCWVKRAQIGATQMIWSAGPASGGNIYLYFTSSDELQLSVDTEASGIVKTTQKFRDPSAWYHIVCAVDTSQATAANRVKFFINGTAVSDFASSTYPSQNHDTHWNHTSAHRIGQRNDGTAFHINAYIAEFYNLDGTAVSDAEDFAEADNNGVWRPIETSGLTFGTNGAYLKFDETATNGIGHDDSGNGNNWTASGFTTSGTGTDVMSDTPTNNFATLDPINVNNSTSALAPSNGNLDLTAHFGRWGTIAVTSGKWYWEVTLTGTNSEYNYYFGAKNVQNGTVEARMMCNGGNTPDGNNISGNSNGTTTQPTGSRPSLPATIGVKLDMDNGDIEFVQGGSVNGKVTGITNWNGPVAPYISSNTSTFNYKTATVNFGQRAFSNTIPTGYSALNTANLPAPTIKDGSDYFQSVLYTGTNASHDITVADNSGNAWGPDLVWIKPRSTADHHRINDKVRGANKTISSNLTNAEYGPSNAYLDSFNSNGFTISSSDAGWNSSSHTYVAWNWLEGASQGFDIVSYAGNDVNGRSIAHSLGVTPAFIVVKARNAVEAWAVWHQDLGGATKYLSFSSTAAVATASAIFGGGANEQLPDSSNFYVGSNGMVNDTGVNYIAYCFAEVEGYSKFGSYTGNGSSDGPFVYCGFKPAFVLMKRTNTTGAWKIFDNKRPNAYNVIDARIEADNTGAESTNSVYSIDLVSNGFKLRGTSGEQNGSGDTFIFAAFASSPFGGDGVSPVTAR